MKSISLRIIVGLLGIIFICYSFIPQTFESQDDILVNIHINDIKRSPKLFPLEWENNNPHRIKWTEHVYGLIEQNFESLELANDIDYFCPNYKNLAHKQKINIWGQLIASISFFESTFNPKARIISPSKTLDPITNKSLVSEGLLQLGYIDIINHNCKFNWEKDSKYDEDDSHKTILNPYRNLSCGMTILTEQIIKHKSIVIKKGAYWAVIKKDHPNSKIEQIKKMFNRYDICEKQ
jgi:hypothetical protein